MHSHVIKALACVFTFEVVGKHFKMLNIAQSWEGDGKLISGTL